MEKIVVEKGVLEKSARKGGAEAALEGYFDTMGIPGYRNTIHVISYVQSCTVQIYLHTDTLNLFEYRYID